MKQSNIRAGKQILDIVTSGMYSNPFMIFREYIQNAADSIDDLNKLTSINQKDSRIDITIDGEKRKIKIIDNGVGVNRSNVDKILCSVAISSKGDRTFRGFRGIGRLGGLGYCDSIIFETRSSSKEHVSMAIWDARRLRDDCRDRNNAAGLIETIKKVVSFKVRKAIYGEPCHFFSVTLIGIHKFHSDSLMNLGQIKQYISQTSPVPFDTGKFKFAQEINKHLTRVDGYRTYNIYINKEKIYKPHSDTFQVNGKSTDSIHCIQLINIKGFNSTEIGRGWFAKSSFIGSIPSNVLMRGLKLRQGNIELGDEHYLADYFTERRFSSWHIGEIHFNYSLRLNARRDGFEQSPELESFYEQARLLCRHLSFLCRNASSSRSIKISNNRMVEEIEKAIECSICTLDGTRKKYLNKASSLISKVIIGKNIEKTSLYQKIRYFYRIIDSLNKSPISLTNYIDGRAIRSIDQKELLQNIAENIMINYSKQRTAESLIGVVFRPYMKRKINLKTLKETCL